MSQKFKKSWLSASIGGALLGTMGTSAMAVDVPNVEDLGNLDNTIAAITSDATGLDAATTSISGDLYQNAGGTIFGAIDANGDEDAFSFYLDGTSSFTAVIDFVDATLTGALVRPSIMLLQDFGGGLYKKATSNAIADGTTTGTQTISYNPAAPSGPAAGAGVGGAGNYLLLVSAFGNTATNPGSASMSPVTFDGATWGGDVMTPSGGTAATYNATISGVANAPSAVPVPAAVWLFGSGLMGLVGVARRRKA